MSDAKFKTMRHIETVRNYLNSCIKILIYRAETHDQSKLESPEVEIFEEYTTKLRDCTYGSDEYKTYLKDMQVALDHHYLFNSHHPEHHVYGIHSMNMFDLLEMVVDWRAAGMRHNDGNIYRSIEINKKRYEMSNELAGLLARTIEYIEEQGRTVNKANES